MIKVYKENAISALKKLADYEFQKRAWLASSGPVISSLSENTCQLYDDTCLGDALNKNQSVFGIQADESLRELLVLIKRVDHVNPQIMLEDPHMQAVREKAEETLRLIQAAS